MVNRLGRIIPLLRIFDADKAREFYADFLGFRIDWEHRFADGLPLYMQISRQHCTLQLTEHHGDCCPGAALRIEVAGLDDFHAELVAKKYKNAVPAIQGMSWGTRDMAIADPFGNRLIFTDADGS